MATNYHTTLYNPAITLYRNQIHYNVAHVLLILPTFCVHQSSGQAYWRLLWANLSQ